MPTPSMPPAAAADHEEPLLAPTPDRFCMFPIRYSQMWEMYKKAEASFWTAEVVDLSTDLFHWDSHVTAEERHFVTRLLAFFAAENHLLAAGRFMKEVQVAEARAFYDFQISVENIHSEMFSLLLETYIRGDADEKTRLFSAMIPCVARKANWALGLQSFAERVAAFACVKGIFYSGSFCAVFWLSYKRGGLLPGLALSSKLISRDEELHCDFACLLYSLLNNKLSEDRIRAIVADAVEIERDFVTDALPVTLIGMNGELLSQYIEFVADRLLGQLGHGKLYGVSNPFDWMEEGTNENFDNEVDIIIDKRKHPSGNHIFKFDEDF